MLTQYEERYLKNESVFMVVDQNKRDLFYIIKLYYIIMSEFIENVNTFKEFPV